MIVKHLEACEQSVVEMDGAKGALRQTPVGVKDGTPTVSARVFTLQPGGHTPHHSHPSEHVNYVIDGEGELISDDGPQPLKKGDFALVLPHERHQYRNTGNTPFVMICVVPKDYE